MPHQLHIEVSEIRGTCPVYKKGDTFSIANGFQLQATGVLCMHSLSSIMPYYVALSRGIPPTELGLGTTNDAAYVQCLDPCELTRGGTVIFKLTVDI